MRRSWVFMLVVLLVTLSLSSTAFAVGQPNAWTKLGRGAVNLTTGWLELPIQTVEGLTSDSPFVGSYFGFGEGILRVVQRTGLGLWDGLTFPVEPYDHPVMEPETTFGPMP